MILSLSKPLSTSIYLFSIRLFFIKVKIEYTNIILLYIGYFFRYVVSSIIAENDYAVAKDDNHKVLLKNENNTYTHAYCYEKGDKIV